MEVLWNKQRIKSSDSSVGVKMELFKKLHQWSTRPNTGDLLRGGTHFCKQNSHYWGRGKGTCFKIWNKEHAIFCKLTRNTPPTLTWVPLATYNIQTTQNKWCPTNATSDASRRSTKPPQFWKSKKIILETSERNRFQTNVTHTLPSPLLSPLSQGNF